MREGRGAMRREECTRGPAFSSLVRLALHFSKENERRSAYAAFRARSLVLERGRPPGARSLARPRRHGIALGRLGGVLVRMGRRVRVASERGFDERLFLAPRRVRGAALGRARGPHERAEPRAARGEGRAGPAETAHRGTRAALAPKRRCLKRHGARDEGRRAPTVPDAGFRGPAQARGAPAAPRRASRRRLGTARPRRTSRRAEDPAAPLRVVRRREEPSRRPRPPGEDDTAVSSFPAPRVRSAPSPRRRPRRGVRRRRARRPARPATDGRPADLDVLRQRTTRAARPGRPRPRTPRRLRDPRFDPSSLRVDAGPRPRSRFASSSGRSRAA